MCDFIRGLFQFFNGIHQGFDFALLGLFLLFQGFDLLFDAEEAGDVLVGFEGGYLLVKFLDGRNGLFQPQHHGKGVERVFSEDFFNGGFFVVKPCIVCTANFLGFFIILLIAQWFDFGFDVGTVGDEILGKCLVFVEFKPVQDRGSLADVAEFFFDQVIQFTGVSLGDDFAIGSDEDGEGQASGTTSFRQGDELVHRKGHFRLFQERFDFIRWPLTVAGDNDKPFGFILVVQFNEVGETGDARRAVDTPVFEENDFSFQVGSLDFRSVQVCGGGELGECDFNSLGVFQPG